MLPVWAETTKPLSAKCANRKQSRLSWSSQTNRGLWDKEEKDRM